MRTIDWNVTARTGVPHVKEFIEERDLTIIVAVDVSGSMAFGSVDWRKCDIAAELAAVFAFSAVQNSDRVGLLLFSESVRAFLPPRRGRAHAQVIVRAAVDAAMRSASGEADFETACRFLERVGRETRGRASCSPIFSTHDFERPLQRLNRQARRRSRCRSSIRARSAFPIAVWRGSSISRSGEARLVDLRRADVARRAAQRR